MDLLITVIVALVVVNAALYAFNKVSSNLRRKASQAIIMRESDKNKLMSRITELNSELRSFKENNVSKADYNNIVHKHNILLNQYRLVNSRNKVLKTRLKKLKDKIY